MASRSLKIALALSMAVNVFLVAGSAAVWIKTKNVSEAETSGRSSRSESMMELVNTRPPEVADPLKEKLRDVALTARPDFEEARAARREAIAITSSDAFDPAKVAELLERSRAAEMRGRARLETGAVDLLAQQQPDDRKALARMLARHRPHSDKPPANARQSPEGH